MSGDHDKALEEFQKSVEHGHHSGWWIWLDVPQFDPIRDDPRFAALADRIQASAAAQRENLARMEQEASL